MKLTYFLFSALIIFSFFSCEKDKCPPVIQELKPGDIDLDSSLVIEPVWHLELNNNEDPGKLSDKYFSVYISKYKISIYSNETGELVTSIDTNTISGFDRYSYTIKDNYLYYDDIDEQTGKAAIYIFNIPTNDVKKIIFNKSIKPLLYKKDYFYYYFDGHLIMSDYEKNPIDTVFAYTGTNIRPDNIFEYKYPAPLNSKLVVIPYHAKNIEGEGKYFIKFLDTDAKKVIRSYDFPGFSAYWSQGAKDEIINCSLENIKFSFDFISKRPFFFISNGYLNSYLFSINKRHTQKGPYGSKVFFTNNSKLTAYDFNTSAVDWVFEKTKEIYGLYPFDLLDSNGNLYPYMTIIFNGHFGLLDPYTGLIKAKVSPHIADFIFSKILDNNEVIITRYHDVYKYKITKK